MNGLLCPGINIQMYLLLALYCITNNVWYTCVHHLFGNKVTQN